MKYVHFERTTGRPGLTFDPCASLGTDRHRLVGVAAALLANSISSFPTILTRNDNSTRHQETESEHSDVSGEHVYLLAGLVVISLLS